MILKYNLSNLKEIRFEQKHLLFSIRFGGSVVQYPAMLGLFITLKLLFNAFANCGFRNKLNILSAN